MNDYVRTTLSVPARIAAPRLLGTILSVDGVSGRIVETEAYSQSDPASHSYRGPKGRNLPMFLPGGHLYVYRSYGVHWCANLVTGRAGDGEAVLIRALEPIAGIQYMLDRRGQNVPLRRLCQGPGNVARALGLTGADSGKPIAGRFSLQPGTPPAQIAVATRVGLTIGDGELLRFFDAESRFVSRRPSQVNLMHP